MINNKCKSNDINANVYTFYLLGNLLMQSIEMLLDQSF